MVVVDLTRNWLRAIARVVVSGIVGVHSLGSLRHVDTSDIFVCWISPEMSQYLR